MSLPNMCGHVDATTNEFCFVRNMPIKFPGTKIARPENLKWTDDIVHRCVQYYSMEYGDIMDRYIYVTAKYFWIERHPHAPGWHVDGPLTNTINYLWYDSYPTEFIDQEFDLTGTYKENQDTMEAEADLSKIVTYNPCVIARLDNTVVHRAQTTDIPGYRRFVRVAMSEERFIQHGNAHNYEFDYNWNIPEER